VLTGIIASLLGQRKAGSRTPITPEDAALAGVFIHGMAGDLAAEAIGEYGLIATDISYYTAIAIKELIG
jgi:NAD(P)H-hydrate epimerase